MSTVTDTTGRSGAIDVGLAAAVALVLPALLYVAGMASLDRLLYPATSIALGGYLYFRRSPWYIGFCVWLFCATPLIRRLADAQAGWDPSNPILLAPYLACGFAALSLFRQLDRPWPAQMWPFAVMLACIAYGFILAALNGRFLSGAIDGMKQSVGPLFALHVLLQPERRAVLHRVAVTSLLVAAPAMGVYGVWQYVSPPPWDVNWMVGAASLGMDSIGRPLPFELRVFSTMNSPGPFGIVMAAAILVGLTQRRFLLGVPAVLPMILGLLLCQYRAIWAGTALGVVCLMFSGPATIKLRVLLIAAAFALGAGSAAVVPEVRQTISDRLQTLSDLGADASGEDRLHQYEHFLLGATGNLVIGEGLAIDGPSRRFDHGNTVIIDSGILAIYLAFGVLVGTVFIGALLFAIRMTFPDACRRCPDMPLYSAVAVATFCQLPFGEVHVGESGFLAWLFIGAAAAAIAENAAPNRLLLARFV